MTTEAEWLARRMRYLESEAETTLALIQSVVRRTDPDSPEGRKLRKTARALHLLIEAADDEDGDAA